MTQLHEAGFTYDSSMTAATAANVSSTDSFWPYTLDEGIANNCLERDICRGQLKLPGLWEIPMHAIFEPNDPTKIHLMVCRLLESGVGEEADVFNRTRGLIRRT